MVVEFFRRRGIYYGWVVLAVCFITLFFVLGFRFAFGVFYVAILEDTGWQRGETAAIFSVAMAVYAVTSVFSGVFFDRFGPRVLFPFGVVILATGLALSSTISELWELYLFYGALVGIAFALLGFIPHMAFVPRWFVRRRGLAASLALSGMGAGSLLISVGAEKMLEFYNWRSLFLWFGILAVVLLIPLTAIFHRNSPEEIGLFPDGDASPPPQPRSKVGGTGGLWWAMGTSRFWLLFVAVSMIGTATMTMVVHQTRLVVDMGYSLTLAAGLFGATGLFRSLGGMVWGALSDRVGRRFCIVIIDCMGLGSLAFILAGESYPHIILLIGFIFLWGFGISAAAPVYASTVADLFPGRHLGKIMGTLDIGFGIGSAGGPFLAGVIFDISGSYRPMLWILVGVVCLHGTSLWLAASQILSPGTEVEKR